MRLLISITILLFSAFASFAQTIKGVVVNNQGNGIDYVSIGINGRNIKELQEITQSNGCVNITLNERTNAIPIIIASNKERKTEILKGREFQLPLVSAMHETKTTDSSSMLGYEYVEIIKTKGDISIEEIDFTVSRCSFDSK